MKQSTVAPLWLYIWVAGASMKIGAIIQNGRTLYGPVTHAQAVAAQETR